MNLQWISHFNAESRSSQQHAAVAQVKSLEGQVKSLEGLAALASSFLQAICC